MWAGNTGLIPLTESFCSAFVRKAEYKMSLIEIFLIGIGLSMDAFAVSVCKGLSVPRVKPRHCLITGLYFGGFQALMPFLGYVAGVSFKSLIMSFDHWIAFILLGIIGVNMIKESRSEGEEVGDSFGVKTMLPLAVATSIDALVVGVTFAFLQVNIAIAVTIIGITTFSFGVIGLKVGNAFGLKYRSRAELFGGIVLVFMGIKILAEHLFFS